MPHKSTMVAWHAKHPGNENGLGKSMVTKYICIYIYIEICSHPGIDRIWKIQWTLTKMEIFIENIIFYLLHNMIYIYIYMLVYIYMCIYIYIHAYMYIYTYTIHSPILSKRSAYAYMILYEHVGTFSPKECNLHPFQHCILHDIHRDAAGIAWPFALQASRKFLPLGAQRSCDCLRQDLGTCLQQFAGICWKLIAGWCF